VNVHRWDLHGILVPPHVDEDGYFRARIDVTWSLGAQSDNALLRRLGSRIQSPFQVEFVILEPGVAVATTELPKENGGLRVRSIVLITPTNATDCRIRAVLSVLDPDATPLRRAVRKLGAGLPEVLAPIFLKFATADFVGDAMIWSHRAHLERPRPLKEDGPIVLYRKWSERYWPEDYAPSASSKKSLPLASRDSRDEVA
jgi:hypothetical protein